MMVAALTVLSLPVFLVILVAYATGHIAGDSALLAWLVLNLAVLAFAAWTGRERSQAVQWDE